MHPSHRAALVLLAAAALGFTFLWLPTSIETSGQVRVGGAPLAGVCVRRQGDPHEVRTDELGRFRLPAHAGPSRHITAWKAGYRIGHATDRAGFHLLSLVPLPQEDNRRYTWIPSDADRDQPAACAHCHGEIHREWSTSAHAHAATNTNLLTFWDGLDPHGAQHKSWNVRDENPLGAGVCSRCHAPTYSSTQIDYNLRDVSGVAARGVHCDLCHKVKDVATPKDGETFGIDAFDFLRPKDGEQIFYGPLRDAVRPGESFGHFPVYKDSRFCAPCHEGRVFGVLAYSTYSEWLASPARREGKHCQDCHMTPSGHLTNIAPGKGGIERDPATLASHETAGASATMLRECLDVKTTLSRTGTAATVSVAIKATGVGHRVPTGFIDRHLVVLVEGWDAAGNELRAVKGPTIGPLGGKDWTDKAGWVIGRWLADETGRFPLPFWLPHEKEHDTRLLPGVVQTRAMTFPSSLSKARIRVVYRRFWHDVAQARGLDHEIHIADRVLP